MTPRLATSTLLVCLWFAGSARAAAVQSYLANTTGNIAGTSDTGQGLPIHFTAQTTTMMTTPGTIALGTITTNPLPTGATLVFDGTPFTINLNVGPVPDGGQELSPGGNPYGALASTPWTYTIHGLLNGSLKGDGTSTLVATMSSILSTAGMLPFPSSAVQFDPQGIAAPTGTTVGSTLLTARVDLAGTPLPAPAPEPTSVAAFAVALAGWAWNRRRTRAAAAAAAQLDPA